MSSEENLNQAPGQTGSLSRFAGTPMAQGSAPENSGRFSGDSLALGKISRNGALPKWRRERCYWFHKIFTNVEKRMANGWRLRESLVWFAWYYRTHRRFYRCEPTRRFRAAFGTLLQNYYTWQQGGRKPEALILNYRPSRLKLPAAKVMAFVETALAPETCTYDAAYARHGDKSATRDAFYHALAPGLRKQLSAMFTLRRAAIRMARKIRRTLPPAR